MAMNDSLHNRETYARPWKLIRAVQALEGAKEFLRILHIKAHSVIPYKVNVLIAFGFRAHLDQGILTGAGKLDRIGKQVHEYLSQQGTVPHAIRQGLHP